MIDEKGTWTGLDENRMERDCTREKRIEQDRNDEKRMSWTGVKRKESAGQD